MSKVSVIVPVYNAEKYLSRTLDSILNQTFKDFEVMIINDGSKDNSLSICEEYSNNYSNVFVYSKENGGLSSARNEGIERSTGKYLMFIDSDDYIDSTMIEDLVSGIENGAQLALCGLSVDYENDSLVTLSTRFCCPSTSQMVEGKRLISNYALELKRDGIIDSCCNKIYLKSIIKDNGLMMPQGQLFEDTEFNFRYLKYVDKLSLISKPYYHYMQRNKNRLTNTYNPKKFLFLKNRILTMLEYLEFVENLSSEYIGELHYWYARYFYSTMIDIVSLNDTGLKNKMLEELNEDVVLQKITSYKASYNNFFKRVYVRSVVNKQKPLILLINKISHYLKQKRNNK